MAIVGTTKFVNTGEAPSGTFTTTDRLSPVPANLYLVAVLSYNFPPSASVTGCGTTWSLVTSSTISGVAVLYLFKGVPLPGSEDALTVSFAGQAQSAVGVAVTEFNFTDATGTPIVQSVTGSNAAASNSTGTTNLAAFADADNASVGFLAHNILEDIYPKANFTELFDSAVGAWKISAQYKNSSDVSPDFSWSTSANYLHIELELAKRTAASTMTLGVGRILETDTALPIAAVQPPVTLSTVRSTRGQMVKRVGEKLGLAYDVEGEERDLLRDLFREGIIEVLLDTHAYIVIGDLALAAGISEYRLDSTAILAIDDGRGSTPAGIGSYELITLDEMIERQSSNIVSPSFRKALAIEGNLMLVSPTPESNESLRFYYVPFPTEPAGDSSDFTDTTYGGLPSWAVRAVEYYMLWQAAEYDQKQQTGPKDMGPIDYKMQYDAECGLIRKRKRKMRSRTLVRPRVGYSEFRRPYISRNDQYPS